MKKIIPTSSYGYIPVSEICNNLLKDLGVNVLTKLHQDEPVSKGKLLHDVLDVVYIAGLGSTTEDENTRCPGNEK